MLLTLGFLYFFRLFLPLNGFNSYLYVDACQRPEIQTHIPSRILYISFGYPIHTLNLAYLNLKSITKSLFPS